MSSPKVKIGVQLPSRDFLLGDRPPTNADQVMEMAERVEAAGLDSVWVGDSLTSKPRLEPLAALAAVAARTKKVRLGTAVMLAGLRHPVLLAQTMATVDLISRGRLVIGASVGGAFNEEQKQEWGHAGVIPAQRARRLEEVVQIVRGLGSGEPLTFSGRHFNLDGVSLGPLPVQSGGIPILLACHWRARQDKQMARTAKLGDGLISISDTPEEYSQLLARVREMADGLGRDVARFETVFYLTVNMGSDLAKAEAESEKFLMGYYGANIWGWRWGPFGDPEKVKARMAEYIEAGAQTVIVRFASFDLERQLDIFLDKVAPAFS